jgi:acyl transferase domain-containing protein
MERIAIIGMAGRFPGADTLARLWENLKSGVESVTVFSEPELLAAGVDPALVRNDRFVAARGILRDAELFDAEFFGYSARDAEMMDPQHRIFLETAWTALEEAGYAASDRAARVGVYAGCSLNQYALSNLAASPTASTAGAAYQALLGNDKDFVTSRVSYKLNLTGPSVTVQTACSTSLVAVQLACEALLSRQCDFAIAGGVAVNVPRVGGFVYEPGMILSPDGHCRVFDAGARGTVVGEGVGVVVLKRLADALADRDHIHAVILGAAVNNDGSQKVGFTALSVDGQAAVIERAQRMAGIHPETITYVEAHGTGTELGDPIEIAALTQAFGRQTSKTGFCAIGSVKSNFGHCATAAGVAGLIKVVLALQHGTIPPSLHFESPNPRIDLGSTPFYVNSRAIDWRSSGPRRAGVSSFGMGGTNAHIVLEEAAPAAATEASRPLQVLTVSARTSEALERASADLAAHLAGDPALNLADVAYTLHVGRAVFPHRRMVVAASAKAAAAALGAQDASVLSRIEARKGRAVIFMFPGGGPQYGGMAGGLYESERTFREQIDASAEILEPILGLDIRAVLCPDDSERADRLLTDGSVAEAALVAVEHALARLFMGFGVRPSAMIGHGVGEYVAACLAGVLSLKDALWLAAERGRLTRAVGDATLSVPLPENELRAVLDGGLEIAAVDGPALCAVSGPASALDLLERTLARRGVRTGRAPISSGSRATGVQQVMAEFRSAVARIELQAPRVPYVSSVTGTWISPEAATDLAYWSRQPWATVRFWDGLQTVRSDLDPVLLELGPGETLISLAHQDHPQPDSVASVRPRHQSHSDAAVLQEAVGRLWLAGVTLDWAGYHSAEQRRRLPLPTYPFERRRHWIGTGSSAAPPAQPNMAKRLDVADWFYAPSWRRAVMPKTPPPTPDSWLVFVDRLGLGEQVVQRLRGSGARAVRVSAHTGFSRRDRDDYVIDPDSFEDHVHLVTALVADGAFPGRVLHSWALGGRPQSGAVDLWSPDDARPFYGLLFLAQALAELGVRDRLEIVVIADGLYDVVGEQVTAPGRAAVIGPCVVLPQEFPNLRCRVVDVVLPEATRGDAGVIDLLIAEPCRPAESPIIAYRGSHRWMLSHEPVRLERPDSDTVLRTGGVYLITGGFGGIGGALARYLAQAVRAKLVLVGRSSVDQPDVGDSEVSASRRMALVRELESLGGEVLPLRADVAVSEEVAYAVKEARRRFGRIDGVIHAAGIATAGIVQLKTRPAAEAVFAAKTRGTAALWAQLKDGPPDFILLCSSMTTFLGGPGQVDYSAANNVLDAFARWARQQKSGPRVISVNWDAWLHAGMAVGADLPDALRAERGRRMAHGIAPAEGVEVFRRILSSELSEIVVSTRELRGLVASSRPVESNAEYRRDRHEARLLTAPGISTGATQMSEVERFIADIWGELLGVEAIGRQSDFFEAGGHSLLATQVMARLYQRFGVDVPLRALFETRTLSAFAERVESLVRPGTGDREEIEI